MRKLLRFSENTFTIISIIYLCQGFFNLIFDTSNIEEAPELSNPIVGLVSYFIYLISSALIILRWKKNYKLILHHKWILFLLLLSAASILWSSVPDMALRRVISLIGTTLFGIYLGTNYDFDRQLKITCWAFGISLVMNFVFVFFFPSYGVMNTRSISGAWQGIYLHKSTLGENMLISFLMFYFLSNSIPKYRFLCNITCLLSIVLVKFSASTASLITLVFIYLLSKFLRYLSFRSKLNISAIFSFLSLLTIAQLALIFNVTTFLDVSNKDITITGRTPLWASLWEFAQSHILLGYGYGSFFSASHTETQILWKIHTWGPPHAHNGYIQILISLGIVGILVFVAGYFYNMSKSLMSYLKYKNPQKLWIFSFLFYTAIFNVTEVSFLRLNSISWAISVAYLYSLSSINTRFFDRK